MIILKLCRHNIIVARDSKIPVGLSLLDLCLLGDLLNNNNNYLV